MILAHLTDGLLPSMPKYDARFVKFTDQRDVRRIQNLTDALGKVDVCERQPLQMHHSVSVSVWKRPWEGWRTVSVALEAATIQMFMLISRKKISKPQIGCYSNCYDFTNVKRTFRSRCTKFPEGDPENENTPHFRGLGTGAPEVFIHYNRETLAPHVHDSLPPGRYQSD